MQWGEGDRGRTKIRIEWCEEENVKTEEQLVWWWAREMKQSVWWWVRENELFVASDVCTIVFFYTIIFSNVTLVCGFFIVHVQ